MLQRIKTERCVCESILRKLIALPRLRRSQTRGRGSCYGVRKVYITCRSHERNMRGDGRNNKLSTTSLSHLRTMLSSSRPRPLPAKRPNHATWSLFHSKSLHNAIAHKIYPYVFLPNQNVIANIVCNSSSPLAASLVLTPAKRTRLLKIF